MKERKKVCEREGEREEIERGEREIEKGGMKVRERERERVGIERKRERERE